MSSPIANHTSKDFVLTDLEIGIMCSVNAIFSIIGSLGNILVCFAFLHFPKLRNTMNIFILSLACSALLVCLIAQPMYAVSLVKHYQQENVTNVFEKVRKCFTWISLLASAGNLFGVTLDRYYAITEPFRYSGHQSVRPRACIFVTVIWLIAVGLGTTATFLKAVKIVTLVYVLVIVMVLILPLYVRILHIAAKHRQKILTTQSFTSNLSVRDQINLPTPLKYRVKLRHKIDRSALKTVGLICVVFVVGWFPLLILPLIYRITKEDKNLILDLFQWVNSVALCSSSVNPIVYAVTDRRFRESLNVMHRKWVIRHQDFGTTPGKSSRGSKRSNDSSQLHA